MGGIPHMSATDASELTPLSRADIDAGVVIVTGLPITAAGAGLQVLWLLLVLALALALARVLPSDRAGTCRGDGSDHGPDDSRDGPVPPAPV